MQIPNICQTYDALIPHVVTITGASLRSSNNCLWAPSLDHVELQKKLLVVLLGMILSKLLCHCSSSDRIHRAVQELLE